MEEQDELTLMICLTLLSIRSDVRLIEMLSNRIDAVDNDRAEMKKKRSFIEFLRRKLKKLNELFRLELSMATRPDEN